MSRWIDHRVWEMKDGRVFVVYDRGAQTAPRPGDVLRVTGQIQPFDRSVLEGELGVNIEDHFYDDDFLQDDVLVVASDIERLP